ncbi:MULTISPECIES: MFS transporter [Lysobacter]|uniref:MFS transporter n=1 Tax=Lysobacter TaxID=68 RepID=UPI001F2D009B|nr:MULTISPECIES: MFS transporter [Lysobacter]UJB21904.1 MFS transporter [Lysobacter capsici]UJQ31156.1 MFS transporter [Lysobacter gummosus]
MMRILGPVLTAHYLAAFTALGLPIFMPRVLAELAPGAPDWLVGVLYVLPTICTALTASAWGRFSDAYGRKLSLMRAQAGLVIGFVLAGTAPNLAVFVLGLIVQGACGGSMAAANAYLSTQSQGAALSRSLDWTQFSARLAMVSAPPLLGLVTGVGQTLQLYLYLAALPALALAITWWLPTDSIAPKPKASAGQGPVAFADDRRELFGLYGVQFLFCFAMVVTFPYFIPYSERLGVGNDSMAGLLYSLPHLVYLLAMPWLRSRQTPSQRRLFGGLFLLALACAAHGALHSAAWLAPVRLLYGAGMLLAFSGINRALSECASGRPAGRLFGTFDACGKWAGALAGVCAGALVHRYGLSMPFFVAAAVSALALSLAVYTFRFQTQRQRHVATNDA